MNLSLRFSQPAGCLRADMKFTALLALAALLFTVAALTQDKGLLQRHVKRGTCLLHQRHLLVCGHHAEPCRQRGFQAQ